MNRREFSRAVKTAAFERCGGACERCTAPLRGPGTQYDHAVPDAVGGEPTLDNCRVLCRTCHDLKTHKTDVPQIAKTKRVRAKHINADTRKRGGFRGHRKFDGSIVWK